MTLWGRITIKRWYGGCDNTRRITQACVHIITPTKFLLLYNIEIKNTMSVGIVNILPRFYFFNFFYINWTSKISFRLDLWANLRGSWQWKFYRTKRDPFRYIYLVECSFLLFQVLPGCLGLFAVGLAFISAIGICSILGIAYGPVHTSLPFLLLGLGVDDMFVIWSCWTSLPSDVRTSPLPKRVAHTLRHAGVSVTVTSATDVIAFCVGATTVNILTAFVLTVAKVLLRLICV